MGKPNTLGDERRFIFASGDNGVGEMGMVTAASLDNWLAEVGKHQQKVGNNTCPNFGYPIRDKLSYHYGRYQHIAWEFSNGFKAFSPDLRGGGFTPLLSNYDIIIDKSEATQAFRDQNLLPQGKELKFSPYIGTYSVYQGGLKTAYLTPKASGAGTTADYQVVKVEGAFLNLADSKADQDIINQVNSQRFASSSFCRGRGTDTNCKKQISILGYPIGNSTIQGIIYQVPGTFTDSQTIGSQQQFIGGMILGKTLQIVSNGQITSSNSSANVLHFGIRDEFLSKGNISASHPYKLAIDNGVTNGLNQILQSFESGTTLTFDFRTPDIVTVETKTGQEETIQQSSAKFVISILPGAGDSADLQVLLTGYDPIFEEDTPRLYGAIALAIGSSQLIKQTVGRVSEGINKAIKIVLKGPGDRVVKELTETFVLRGGRWIAHSAAQVLDASKKELIDKTRSLSAYIPETEQLVKRIEIDFNTLTKQTSDEAFENIIARKAEVMDNLIRDRALRGLSETFGISIKRLEHVIKGEFDSTGRFLGGLHEWAEVKKAFKAGKIKIFFDKAGTLPIKNLDEIEAPNGVRSFFIQRFSKKTGKLLDDLDLKTIFPDDWSYEDIVKAGKELKEKGVRKIIEESRPDLVEILYYHQNGKVFKIRGFKTESGVLDSWFPFTK